MRGIVIGGLEAWRREKVREFLERGKWFKERRGGLNAWVLGIFLVAELGGGDWTFCV